MISCFINLINHKGYQSRKIFGIRTVSIKPQHKSVISGVHYKCIGSEFWKVLSLQIITATFVQQSESQLNAKIRMLTGSQKLRQKKLGTFSLRTLLPSNKKFLWPIVLRRWCKYHGEDGVKPVTEASKRASWDPAFANPSGWTAKTRRQAKFLFLQEPVSEYSFCCCWFFFYVIVSMLYHFASMFLYTFI